jgi:hypothetical protein
MGARSYVPQLGRFLQPDPIPGGSANAYSYTFGDPVNATDPTGDYVEGAYLNAVNDAQNQEAVEREEAREAAARAAAEQSAREAAANAAAAAGPQYAGGEEEWEEWEEEGGEYEYASYKPHAENGKGEEAHVEPVSLYQPLAVSSGGGEADIDATVRVCQDGSEDSSRTKGCARYASAWGFIEEFGHEAENLYHKGRHFVHKLLGAIGLRHLNSGDYACAAFGVGVAIYLRDSPFVEQAIGGVLGGLGCDAETN